MKKVGFFLLGLVSCCILVACGDGDVKQKLSCASFQDFCVDDYTAIICRDGSIDMLRCTEATPVCRGGQCVASGSGSGNNVVNGSCKKADNKCLDGHTASVCLYGSMQTVNCTGSTPDCVGGTCVATGNVGTACSSRDDKCIDEHSASVCIYGTLQTVNCSGDTPDCKNGKCVRLSNGSGSCTPSDNTCLDAHTASVCLYGDMQTIGCSGNLPDCKNGDCVPSENVGDVCTKDDNTCLDAHTASVCVNGAMQTMNCSGDTPDCVGGACVWASEGGSCTSADNTCLDAHTAYICKEGWMQAVACGSEMSDCVDGVCVWSGNACTADDDECLDEHTVSACIFGTVQTLHCSGDTPDCVGGECVYAGGNSCTSSDDKCLDPHTASICLNGSMQTVNCSGDTPDCIGGRCLLTQVNTCTSMDDKCLDPHTASVCLNGSMQTVNCSGATPDCVGGACISNGGSSTCTSADNECLDAHTATVCTFGVMQTVECGGSTPDCRGGSCVEAPCEEGAISCISDKIPQKCINQVWVEQDGCADNTFCMNGVGCQAECDEGASKCKEDGSALLTCINGRWETELCPAMAPWCTDGACRDAEFEWCSFHWLEVSGNTARGYGRVLIPEGVDPNDINAYMSCHYDNYKTDLDHWTTVEASVNPQCDTCGNNTEYMSDIFTATENGYYYCVFQIEYNAHQYICQPRQTGALTPIRFTVDGNLSDYAYYTRYFYAGSCKKNGDRVCVQNDVMYCDNHTLEQLQTCDVRCSVEQDKWTNAEISSCGGECSGNREFCSTYNTILSCENGEYVETRCNTFCRSGECVECRTGDLKCIGQTPYECVSGSWEAKQRCADNEVCLTHTKYERCAEECSEGETACNPETASLKRCVNGRWRETKCPDATPYCHLGDVACSVESCQGRDPYCNEKKFGLMVCNNGSWDLSPCPVQKPYCKTGQSSCTELRDWDDCDLDTFIPFARDFRLFVCASPGGGSGKIYIQDCNGKCTEAFEGYGVNTSNGLTCSIEDEGKTKTLYIRDTWYWNDTHTLMNETRWYVCNQCKRDQNATFRYMIVPGEFYKDSTAPISCIPYNP